MSDKLIIPIKYYGGKFNMSKNILKHFPEKTEYDTYIEPFGGSYSIGLKLDPPPKIEMYNDLDHNVFSLYKVLSDPSLFPEFKHNCDMALYSEEIRDLFKRELTTVDLSVIDRAFYFFYVNRTSHNGSGGFSKNTHIRRNMSKSVSDFLSSIDRLDDLHDRLSRVIVSCTDGINMVKKYNTPNVMIYADPPYEQSTRTGVRYKVDMTREEHQKFLAACIESEAKILVSGYECETYEVLTDNGFEKIQFEVKTVSAKFEKKTKIEKLWKNY